jgi:putative transposase
MAEIDRLAGNTNWIDVEFVERERTSEPIIEVGIQLYLAGLLLSNTKQALDSWVSAVVEPLSTAGAKKADLRPTSDTTPNHIAVDETVIRIDDEHHWLYAAVSPSIVTA